MIRSILRNGGTAICWSVLTLMLVLAPTLGSASSVLALLLCLMLLPLVWREGFAAQIASAPAQAIFTGVVAVLTVLYALSARKPEDVLFFANFLGALLSALIFTVALERRGPKAAMLIVYLCLAGAFVGLGWALYDVFVRGLDRAQGLIGNPNLMPRQTLTLGFIAMSGVFIDKGARRWLYLVGPVAALLTTVLCGSRGAALAIPAMALIALVFLLRAQKVRGVVLVLVALAVIGVALLAQAVGELSRFSGIASVIFDVLSGGHANGDSATNERLEMYRTGFEAFQKSPWIGWGWANLGNVAAETNPAVFSAAAGTLFMYHSDAVNFAVAAGIPGLICLLALLVAPVIGALATPRDTLFSVRLYCCLILSAGYAIFGLTDSTLGYDAPTTLYAFLTAMVLGAFRDSPQPQTEPRTEP